MFSLNLHFFQTIFTNTLEISMYLFNLMTICSLFSSCHNRTLNINIYDSAAFFTKKMMMMRSNIIIPYLCSGDRYGRCQSLFQEGVYGVINRRHRYRWDLPRECFINRLNSRVFVHMFIQIFKNFQSLICRFQAFCFQKILQLMNVCNHFHDGIIIIRKNSMSSRQWKQPSCFRRGKRFHSFSPLMPIVTDSNGIFLPACFIAC
jgi:hypothetical protein